VAAKSSEGYFDAFDTIDYRGLNIAFRGKQPKVRERVLRGAIPLYPNYIYNYSQVNRTYSNLMSMGYFKSARIIFNELPDSTLQNNFTTLIGDNSASQSRALNYTREGYLDCNILCTPALRQSIKAEIEARRLRASTA
jgi:outer membrane protein assembly factor BamA